MADLDKNAENENVDEVKETDTVETAEDVDNENVDQKEAEAKEAKEAEKAQAKEVKEAEKAEAKAAKEAEKAVRRDVTEESDVKASAERRRESVIEQGGKVAYASDVLKVGKGKTDVNPLDGKEIDKDSRFNPTRGI